ncbi:hypothetical protein [Halorubrum tebenquichense]|uniref:hypothetical protein n=1 Tax=Halorubrum tebenquichense TaxID=119434 RepID=UPI001267C954|nr:hypothetical protein [Halorubrum tebenquichense]
MSSEQETEEIAHEPQELNTGQLRQELAKIVGFDHKQRWSAWGNPSTFTNGELSALVNYLRFHEDKKPQPVGKNTTKIKLEKEISERSGYENSVGRLRKPELIKALQHFREVENDSE